MKKRIRKNEVKPKECEELSVREIQKAEELWVQYVQGLTVPEELAFLTIKTRVSPSNVSRFGLYIDEDVVKRCRGRLDNASVSDSSKRLILIPKYHIFTDLVVQEVHQ